MAKILKDLFNGNLTPSDRPMPKGSVMHRLSTKLCECEETLAKWQDKEGREQLEALTRTQWEMDCLTAEENFILGFRLGVQLMVECLTGEEDA